MPNFDSSRTMKYVLQFMLISLSVLRVTLFNQRLWENKTVGFISNGEIYDQIKYPYLMLILYEINDTFAMTCTGSLLSRSFLLTAAHCTDNFDVLTNYEVST